MKQILTNLSKRWGYDGWAVKCKEAKRVLDWTVCTTRAEARELLCDLSDSDVYSINNIDFEIVKVRVSVTTLPTPPTEDKNDGHTDY